MFHAPPGTSGIISSIGIGCLVWTLRRKGKTASAYNLGQGGDPKNYEPILARYIRLSEFMIGLATGSIVLIVGSSALHGQGGRLPWFYASPLLLIAGCAVYGLLFMAAQLVRMEQALHGDPHTAFSYALNETLGYSSLAFWWAIYG